MKKIINLILLIVIISVGYTWYHFSQYHIEDNITTIQSNLKEWLSRGPGTVNPDILEMVQLDDTSSYIVLFETQNNHIGFAHFIKGWNGKFKIDHSGHGTNIIDYRKINTNKGIYGVLIGKNPNSLITQVKADLYNDDFSFKFNINNEVKFVRHEKIPNDIEEPYPAELTFYDSNDDVIELSKLLN